MPTQVLGLLVRHATFIAEELAQTGVVEILTDALKDKMEKVRCGHVVGNSLRSFPYPLAVTYKWQVERLMSL
jgi:L-aminopeptidase/D-esterase-like protein